jgi:hypothetical protein
VRTAAVILSAVGIILFAGCKKPNYAPDTPAVPSGPTSAAVGVEYTFLSSATDPDGDSVAIRFDWGDGDTSNWSSYVLSDDPVAMSHVWQSAATFCVGTQAKDRQGASSAWSSKLAIPVAPGWTRTFGGVYHDEGNSVRMTQDGGYVVAGNTDPNGDGWDDFCLIKVAASGDTVWTRTYGGASEDVGKAVWETWDGGYIVGGYTYSYGAGLYDCWLVKTNADGDTAWTRAFGGYDYDRGYCVEQTRDDGYIFVGVTFTYGAGEADVWLAKLDAVGNMVWSKTFGGTDGDIGNSVQQTSDGGYVIAATTWSRGAGGADAWLLKVDSGGNLVWDKTLGGRCYDCINSVQQTQDGGYIAVGRTDSYGAGDADVWLVRTDSSGETVWTKAFGGTGLDIGNSVQQTRDGGYVVAGYTLSFGAGDADAWLIKTDAVGETAWTRTFGGTSGDEGNSVLQTIDGGYVVAGYTHSYGAGASDVWLIKTDADGRVDEGGGK